MIERVGEKCSVLVSFKRRGPRKGEVLRKLVRKGRGRWQRMRGNGKKKRRA